MEKLSKIAAFPSFVQQALTVSQTGLLVLNLKGEILFLNDYATNLLGSLTGGRFGYIPKLNPLIFPNIEKETKLNFWQVFSDEFLGFSMKEALQLGMCPKKIYRSFSNKELQMETLFIFEGPKEDHGLLITIKDITEQVRTSQELQRKSQLEKLGAMLQELSLEIKAPLGGIRGHASLLSRDLDCHKNFQQMANSIVENTKTLEKMIGQILQFAKPIDLNCKTIEMNQFLRKFIKFAKAQTYCEKIHWDLHLTETQIYAPIDPELMQTAFLNIVLNAIQAMPEGGVLTIFFVKKDRNLEITFSDTGLGIAESDLEKIFTPYFSSKENSSGLGLSQTQKIIQAHFGKISIHSCLKKGTSVSILIPLSRG